MRSGKAERMSPATGPRDWRSCCFDRVLALLDPTGVRSGCLSAELLAADDGFCDGRVADSGVSLRRLLSTLRAMRVHSLPRLAASVACLGIGLALPSHAQEGVPPLKPVTQQEMSSYMSIAAINVCVLLSEKVDFKTAMRANVQSYGSWISAAHGGIIESINNSKKMSDNQLASGIAQEIALGALQRCEKLLPPTDAKQIQLLMKQLEASGQPEGSPAKPAKPTKPAKSSQ